jgi:hypothetical protein
VYVHALTSELSSIEVKFSADNDLDHLIQRAEARETHLIDVPIKGDYRLLCDYFIIEKFDSPDDTLGHSVQVF